MWWKRSRRCRSPSGYAICLVGLRVKKPRYPGCPRCRLDRIVFTREVRLPRFTMRAGEEWELPQSRYTADGAELGGGTIPAGSFEIIEADESRACGCDCTVRPGGPKRSRPHRT